MDGAQASLAKLREKVKELGNGVSKLDSEVNSKPSVKEYKKKFLAMIDDNLDTAGTLALVWEIVKNDDISDVDRKKLVLNFDKVLGLKLNKKTTVKIPENVKLLVKERDTARSEKDFAKSDELRKKIEQLGFEVKDTSEGTTVNLLKT